MLLNDFKAATMYPIPPFSWVFYAALVYRPVFKFYRFPFDS